MDKEDNVYRANPVYRHNDKNIYQCVNGRKLNIPEELFNMIKHSEVLYVYTYNYQIQAIFSHNSISEGRKFYANINTRLNSQLLKEAIFE